MMPSDTKENANNVPMLNINRNMISQAQLNKKYINSLFHFELMDWDNPNDDFNNI